MKLYSVTVETEARTTADGSRDRPAEERVPLQPVTTEVDSTPSQTEQAPDIQIDLDVEESE